jgi:hypothetical protein
MGSGGLVVNSSSLDKVINESWFDEEFCIHGMPWPIFYTKKKTLIFTSQMKDKIKHQFAL